MYIYIKFIQYILIMFQFLPDSPHIHTHQVHRLSVFQSKTKHSQTSNNKQIKSQMKKEGLESPARGSSRTLPPCLTCLLDCDKLGEVEMGEVCRAPENLC